MKLFSLLNQEVSPIRLRFEEFYRIDLFECNRLYPLLGVTTFVSHL